MGLFNSKLLEDSIVIVKITPQFNFFPNTFEDSFTIKDKIKLLKKNINKIKKDIELNYSIYFDNNKIDNIKVKLLEVTIDNNANIIIKEDVKVKNNTENNMTEKWFLSDFQIESDDTFGGEPTILQNIIIKGTKTQIDVFLTTPTNIEIIPKNKQISSKIYKRKGPLESANLFDVGTQKKGLDNNMWEIISTKKGIKRWKKI